MAQKACRFCGLKHPEGRGDRTDGWLYECVKKLGAEVKRLKKLEESACLAGGCGDCETCLAHNERALKKARENCTHPKPHREVMTGEGNTVYCRECGKLLEDSK